MRYATLRCTGKDDKGERGEGVRRNWIKIYVDQSLRGTMMEEMKDPAEPVSYTHLTLPTSDLV